MEKLIIKDFLILKEVEFEVGKINIIIGSQATGKSIIAKLLYFFREFLSKTFISSSFGGPGEKDFKKRGLDDFAKYFPDYVWQSQPFKIIYISNSIEITLENISESSSQKDLKLDLDYSENLNSLHSKLKDYHTPPNPPPNPSPLKAQQPQESDNKKIYGFQSFALVTPDQTYEYICNNTEYGSSFHQSLFIPAGRSFFAHLQNNIFSLLSHGIEIDPFISNFGSYYERTKKLSLSKNMDQDIEKIIKNILKGQYHYTDRQDWIEFDNGYKVNLVNTSSGQQEVLPILMSMAFDYPSSDFLLTTFFIEEPEAHLFPFAQKEIVSLIALIYNKRSNNFLLTTHSPYILTAMNNFILVHDVIKEKGEDKVKSILNPDFAVKYEDVKAYTIEEGKLISIMNDENRLIGVNIIDAVSDEFSEEFDKLLDIMEN